MYGIFTYIWVIYGVNVDKYSIHGASHKKKDIFYHITRSSASAWVGVNALHLGHLREDLAFFGFLRDAGGRWIREMHRGHAVRPRRADQRVVTSEWL